MLALWDKAIEELEQKQRSVMQAAVQKLLPYEEYARLVGQYRATTELLNQMQSWREQFLHTVGN